MGAKSSKFLPVIRLEKKTVIVTGSNTGIGKSVSKEFFKLGARVIMACRDISKGKLAAEEIMKEVNENGNGELIIKCLDLSSLSSVRQCANEILETEKEIHILINNAGIMMCPKWTTVDGFEGQFGVNHLGHFLFTNLLLPKIITSAPARIINVSSSAHERGVMDWSDLNWEKKPYSSLGAYAQSKLANVLFTTELSRRLSGKGVSTYAVHPGIVRTELGRYLDETYFPGFRWIAQLVFASSSISPEEGAQTILYCAASEDVENETNLYYSDCKRKETNATQQVEDAKKLWDLSAQMVGLTDG